MPDDRIAEVDLAELTAELARILIDKGWKISVAESCTGGWIAKTLTDLAGSSRWFELGVVSYSNSAKGKALGVPSSLLESHGAVSEPVAMAMVQGVVELVRTNVGVSVTGIAGPGGGSKEKPVGTVCFGFLSPNSGLEAKTVTFSGDRESIRRQTVMFALQNLSSLLIQGR